MVKLTGAQTRALSDFADGADVKVWEKFKWTTPGIKADILRWIIVHRLDDGVKVIIFEDGTLEPYKPSHEITRNG